MSVSLWKQYGETLKNTYGLNGVVRCKYCGIWLATKSEMELMAKDAEKESGIPWENYMWAGVGEATVDHVVPQSLGGTDDIENLVPCCKTCNSKKGSRNTISVSMEYPDADYLFDPANKLGKRGATR